MNYEKSLQGTCFPGWSGSSLSAANFSKKALLKHIKDNHPGTKFQCKFCGKQYDSFNGCYKHERSAHSKKNYFCSICGHAFDYKSQVEGHMPIHNPAQKVYCETCGKGFATTISKKRHSVIHMNLQFPCGNCTKVFNTPEKRQRHFKGTHGTGYQSLWFLYIQLAWQASQTPGRLYRL